MDDDVDSDTTFISLIADSQTLILQILFTNTILLLLTMTRFISLHMPLFLAVLCLLCQGSNAFTPSKNPAFVKVSSVSPMTTSSFRPNVLLATPDEEATTSDTVTEEKKKLTLEEKMKAWEATEAEIKAASLGGIIPQPSAGRADAFDVGLWIVFPLMVVSGLIFAFFPIIMENIDVSSVGPPPTV